jgi:hypothetical protein
MFDLSLTDYERLMSMARRADLVGVQKRRKDSANNYSLTVENHLFVLGYAKKIECTCQVPAGCKPSF